MLTNRDGLRGCLSGSGRDQITQNRGVEQICVCKERSRKGHGASCEEDKGSERTWVGMEEIYAYSGDTGMLGIRVCMRGKQKKFECLEKEWKRSSKIMNQAGGASEHAWRGMEGIWIGIEGHGGDKSCPQWEESRCPKQDTEDLSLRWTKMIWAHIEL